MLLQRKKLYKKSLMTAEKTLKSCQKNMIFLDKAILFESLKLRLSVKFRICMNIFLHISHLTLVSAFPYLLSNICRKDKFVSNILDKLLYSYFKSSLRHF